MTFKKLLIAFHGAIAVLKVICQIGGDKYEKTQTDRQTCTKPIFGIIIYVVSVVRFFFYKNKISVICMLSTVSTEQFQYEPA